MNTVTGLPAAISIYQLGEIYDIPAGVLPKIPARLPEDVTFKIGRTWMVFTDKVRQHIEAGGSL